MLTRLLAALAVLEALYPNRLIEFAERLAFRTRGDASLRPWTVPLARTEGAVGVALLLRGRPTATLSPVFVLVGVPALLAPTALVDAALRLAYRDADSIEVRSWVAPATRLLGFGYLVLALRAVTDRGESA